MEPAIPATGVAVVNWARLNSHRLDDANYVRNATKTTKYYIEILPSGLAPLDGRFGAGWCVVICGDPYKADDYYVIPSGYFRPWLRQEHMQPKGRPNPKPVRWLFQVKDGLLVFFPPKHLEAEVADRTVNVRQFYGNRFALYSAID